nr:unnamed protein product [Callosobruchus analis]
MHYFLIIIRVL